MSRAGGVGVGGGAQRGLGRVRQMSVYSAAATKRRAGALKKQQISLPQTSNERPSASIFAKHEISGARVNGKAN